jgi:hypothetical protein
MLTGRHDYFQLRVPVCSHAAITSQKYPLWRAVDVNRRVWLGSSTAAILAALRRTITARLTSAARLSRFLAVMERTPRQLGGSPRVKSSGDVMLTPCAPV